MHMQSNGKITMFLFCSEIKYLLIHMKRECNVLNGQWVHAYIHCNVIASRLT